MKNKKHPTTNIERRTSKAEAPMRALICFENRLLIVDDDRAAGKALVWDGVEAILTNTEEALALAAGSFAFGVIPDVEALAALEALGTFHTDSNQGTNKIPAGVGPGFASGGEDFA